MGFYHSAFLAYGIQIPDMDEDTLDRGIPGGSEVGHLRAGRYDAEDTFLVTKCTEAEIGTPVVVDPERATREQYETWSRDLRAAATALGVTDIPAPSWLLISHVS
ncbi:hypothetical protein JTP67_05905 [Streptomyces sp. S12]|nr:hypothetical protein [Streptomyces sp. S12]